MTVAGNKILIVDEQEGICAQLSEYLQREGMIPVVAHTGAAALDKIRTEAPDLLIVDLKLPDMSGMQAMQAAKALDEDLPTILATGYPNIREAVAAIRAGAHDYLEKPLKHHEVLRVVFRALNERKLKRKLRQPVLQGGRRSGPARVHGTQQRSHAPDLGSEAGRQDRFQCPDSGGNRGRERPGGPRHPRT